MLKFVFLTTLLLVIRTSQQQELNTEVINSTGTDQITTGPNIIDLLLPGKKPDNKQICGYANPNGIDRSPIELGPNVAKYAEFPWMAAILQQQQQYSPNPSYQFICGGSLIHPSVVLTAAHCVQNKEIRDLLVRTGEWNLNSKLEKIPEQDQYISEIIIHDQYNAMNSINDIALLFFTRPFHMKDQVVGPICLLPSITTNFDSRNCFTSGWNQPLNQEFQNPENFLTKSNQLSILSTRECEQKLRTTNNARDIGLNDSFLCTTKNNNTNCNKFGNGGSPLICPIPGYPNRYYQLGIITKLEIQCDGRSPIGRYVNVAMLRTWINRILNQKNIDTNFFTPDLQMAANSSKLQNQTDLYAL